jgi:hypothetical protein
MCVALTVVLRAVNKHGVAALLGVAADCAVRVGRRAAHVLRNNFVIIAATKLKLRL